MEGLNSTKAASENGRRCIREYLTLVAEFAVKPRSEPKREGSFRSAHKPNRHLEGL